MLGFFSHILHIIRIENQIVSVLIDRIMFKNSLQVFSVHYKLQDYCACVVGFRGYRESFLSHFVMNSSCFPQSRWDVRVFCHFSPVRLPVTSLLFLFHPAIGIFSTHFLVGYTTFPCTFPRAFRYEFKMHCLLQSG